MKLSVSSIQPNPKQPRTYFDPAVLQELADSIRENGLQSPILVEDNGDETYTLVAGERRLRAHKLLGLTEIEAIVRPLTNHGGTQRLLDAMIENVQRANMTPVEEAQGYRRLRDEHGMSPTEISKRMGVSLTSVLGRLKITELEPEIQELIALKALPGSSDPVDAFLSLPAGEPRVKLARALATRSATIKMIQNACQRLALTLEAKRPEGKYSKNPGLHVAALKARVNPEALEKEWDALYQVNRVPRWPLYVDSIQETCRSCSLYPVASEATCRDCPLVDSIRRLLEAVDAN